MKDAPQTTPQQVIAHDVVADGDPRGEIVADRILTALSLAGFEVVPRDLYRCTICGGRVDLSNAVKPTVRIKA